MARAGIVLLDGTRVALIKRIAPWHDGPYYLFPGGVVQDEETPADAAMREAQEELGLTVWLQRLLATGRNQFYFLATRVSGTFGLGAGEELQNAPDHQDGTYTPMWMELRDLPVLDVRPKSLALLLVRNLGAPPESDPVLEFED
jgi:8-oxo-dGTP pyrophosphatase MutT (NUDIX family)